MSTHQVRDLTSRLITDADAMAQDFFAATLGSSPGGRADFDAMSAALSSLVDRANRLRLAVDLARDGYGVSYDGYLYPPADPAMVGTAIRTDLLAAVTRRITWTDDDYRADELPAGRVNRGELRG